MQETTFVWTVSQQHDGMMLRNFLRVEKQISKRALTDIKFAGGAILVNGEPATVRKSLAGGDQVTVKFPLELRSAGMEPKQIPFDIIYEDDHVIVVNKPAGLLTIPSKERADEALANAVLYYYEKHGITHTFHAVNRLDRDTSGLLLVAKHRYAHDLMTRAQKQGRLSRRYVAVIHACMKSNAGTIDAPIARKRDSIIEREVSADGQKAVTHYAVLERLGEAAVVSINLETGRTHQIRVHFASIGHPLVGDSLYGGERDGISRQALHSCEIKFYHPFLEKELSFTAPIPADMQQLITSRK